MGRERRRLQGSLGLEERPWGARDWRDGMEGRFRVTFNDAFIYHHINGAYGVNLFDISYRV